jgi:hypothetical protein
VIFKVLGQLAHLTVDQQVLRTNFLLQEIKKPDPECPVPARVLAQGVELEGGKGYTIQT